jgi:hypothetical protein
LQEGRHIGKLPWTGIKIIDLQILGDIGGCFIETSHNCSRLFL